MHTLPFPRTLRPAGPDRAQESPAQLGFAPDSSCGRWKRRVSSLQPSQHFSLSSCCFPGMGQHSRQCPWGQDWVFASAPPALAVAQPLGTEPAQPAGAPVHPQPCGTTVSSEH